MNRRLIHTLVAALSAVSLMGCAQTKLVSNPRAAVQPQAGGLDATNFRQEWMNIVPLDAGDAIKRLYVSEDLVLACTPKNVVYTLGSTNGVVKYFRYVNGGGREIGRPLVLGKYVVYPGQSNLEVYNRSAGDLAKSIPLGFTISSNAVGDGDQVYLGADLGGGELADVDLTRRYVPVRWSLLAFGEVRGAPALFNTILYLGSGDGGLRAINQDREAYWLLPHDLFDTGGAIVGDVSADEVGVYAASESGRLVCVDRDTGQLKWQYFSPRPLKDGPVVTRTTVYQYVPRVGLVAVDKSKLVAVEAGGRAKVEEMNRASRWICREAEQFVAEDRLFAYVRTADNQLLAVDRLTGDVRYREHGGRFAAMATNVHDGVIYAATADGVIYAIKSVLQPGSPGYLQ